MATYKICRYPLCIPTYYSIKVYTTRVQVILVNQIKQKKTFEIQPSEVQYSLKNSGKIIIIYLSSSTTLNCINGTLSISFYF